MNNSNHQIAEMTAQILFKKIITAILFIGIVYLIAVNINTVLWILALPGMMLLQWLLPKKSGELLYNIIFILLPYILILVGLLEDKVTEFIKTRKE